jgi:hypothetical protein
LILYKENIKGNMKKKLAKLLKAYHKKYDAFGNKKKK